MGWRVHGSPHTTHLLRLELLRELIHILLRGHAGHLRWSLTEVVCVGHLLGHDAHVVLLLGDLLLLLLQYFDLLLERQLLH